MKKLFLFTLILFNTSCYQPIPDGKYRLINLNGIKKNSSNQYFSIKGQEFNSFSVENGLKKEKVDLLYVYSSDQNEELKTILNEFELRINDEKTIITNTHNELESDWALAIKSFYFRPSEKDQREDIWNFFSSVFNLLRMVLLCL